MIEVNYWGFVAFGSTVIIGLCPQAMGQTPSAGQSGAQIDQISRWLPADSAVLIVSTGPTGRNKPAKPATIASSLPTYVFIGVPGELGTFPCQYSVQGARNFRPPMGLGAEFFEGATVASMTPPNLQALDSIAKQKADHKGTVGGHPAYVFEREISHDMYSFYVVFDRGLMFSATDKAYLEELLKRRDNPGPTSAFPPTLPEWKYVDKAAPFWALRKFRPGDMQDPTGLSDNAGVTGAAVSLDASGDLLTLEFTSARPDAYGKVETKWQSETKDPTVKMSKLDSATLVVLNAQVPWVQNVSLFVLALLGHQIVM